MNKRQKKKTKTVMAPVYRKKKLNRFLGRISTKWPLSFRLFRDGYFVFYFGGNSVCHFGLKELPDWTFGIWLTEKYPQFFGEHNDLIDKFKPSRCYISETNIDQFILMLSKIIENQDLYFVASETNGDVFIPYEEEQHDDMDFPYVKGYQASYIFDGGKLVGRARDESMTQEQYVKNKIKEHKETIQKQKEEDQFDYDLVFNFFRTMPYLSNDIKAVYVVDNNTGGMSCSPRYYIDILIEDISQEENKKLDDTIRAICREIHNKKKTYDYNFDVCDYYVEADGEDFVHELKKEKRNYNYKFVRKPVKVEIITPKRGPNGEAILPKEEFDDWD